MLLDIALEINISELDFWDMTIAEVNRAAAAYNKRKHREQQELASADYTLASTIGKYFSVVMSGKGKPPSLQEVYPDLFDDLLEQQEQAMAEKKAELSALRFKQFSHFHNSRFNKEVHKAVNE